MTATEARVIHVSEQRGDDQLGDGSQECPFLTIDQAQAVKQPGDVLNIDGFVTNVVFWPVQTYMPDPIVDLTGRRTVHSDGSYVALVTCLAAVLIGFATHSMVWPILMVGVVAVAMLLLGRWFDRPEVRQ